MPSRSTPAGPPQTAPPPAAGPRYLALLQLLRTTETVWNASRVFFARWDLSSSQFNVLNLLHGQPEGLSQIELSRRLITHRSNVTGLVDRLEERGLLAREAVPGDRRAYRVRLTPSGRKLVGGILPEYHAQAEAVLLPVPSSRLGTFTRQLHDIEVAVHRIASELESPRQ